MKTSRNGHQLMSERNATNRVLHPQPGTDDTDEYGITATAGNSIAPAGTRVRVIGAHIAVSGTLEIRDAAGQFVTEVLYSAVPESYRFGAEGIQLENGMSIEISGIAATTVWYLIYEMN